MTAWLTTEQADTYFSTRLGASAFWTAETEKSAALTTAQHQIESCGRYTFDDEALAAPTQAMQDAVCEQALFLLRQGDALDKRADLQAQGVSAAGIVKEIYDVENAPQGVVITQMAESLLKTFETSSSTGSIPLTR